MPADVEEVDAEHIRAFMLAEEQRTSAASAAVHFRNLRVFFGWLAGGRAREREPDGPRGSAEGHQEGQAVLCRRGTSRLLKTCPGATFADRRDTAILRIFIDTGMRCPGWPACATTQTRSSATMCF